MNAKLNKLGHLSIERKGKFKAQYCPYVNGEQAIACSDCCPRLIEYDSADLEGKKKTDQIYTCGGVPMDLTVDERQEFVHLTNKPSTERGG